MWAPSTEWRSRGRFAATSGRLSTSNSSGLLPKMTEKSPVLVWLTDVAQFIPNVTAAGVQMAGPEALTVGWEALWDVMRRMGIPSREQFAERIHNQGFPMPRWRAHIRGRVQERILNIEIAQDARVSALEAVYVMVTLAECKHSHAPVVPPTPRATAPDINNDLPDSCWEALDHINLQEVFESRFAVLQKLSPFCSRQVLTDSPACSQGKV